MKRGLIIITTLVLLFFTQQGCDEIVDNWEEHKDRNTIYGSGRLVDVDLDYNNFNKLVLTHVYSANITQGQEFYVSLKRLGVPTEMIVYPRTPHGPREPKFLMDVSFRIMKWFEQHLRGKAFAESQSKNTAVKSLGEIEE